MGSRIGGDLIDQADREESDRLGEQVLLDRKREDLARKEAALFETEQATFNNLMLELNSDKNTRALQQSIETITFREQFDSNVTRVNTLFSSIDIGG